MSKSIQNCNIQKLLL